MTRKLSAWYLNASCLAAVLLLAACSQGAAPSATTTTTEGADAATALKPVATIQDLMDGLVMPSADVLWGATSSVTDDTGVHDNSPKTDADWKKVRRSAITLIETSNLLIGVRRKVAPVAFPADPTSNSLGSSDIEKLLDANWASFAGFGVAMRSVGETLLQAVDERNLDKISDAGSTLDEVCESCHKVFWYPDPKQQDATKQ